MLPKLSKSSKLKDEIRYFESKLKIMSESDQEFVRLRIQKIKNLSENIDTAHDIYYNGVITPGLVSNTRNELNQSRLEIFKKISYYT